MSDFVPRLLVGGRYLDLKWVGNKWSIMRRFAASSALLKLAAALFLLATLWMSYEYLLSRSVPGSGGRAARASLEEERRCLYRQGLNPAADGHLADNDTYSQFFCGADRYPAGLCTVHLAYFSHGERRFVAKVKELYESRMNNQLSSRMWPVRASSQGWPRCTQYFDEAFVFDVDNSISDDLYFQLHMKSLIPLYSLLALRKHLGPPPAPGYSVVLLPAVEDYSLKTVDWHTEAFSEAHKFGYLQQMVEVFAGGTSVLPLVIDSLFPGEIVCLRVVHFGVGTVDGSDVVLQEGFSQFMQGRLGLSLPLPEPTEPRVCLAKRSKNRRILNEDGLVAALSKFVKVQVTQFDAVSYREQVSQMQQFTILAGFHGEELINALYMPLDSVTIQLIPYNVQSLDTEKYARILRSRGPYLEWQNTHEQNSRPNQVEDSDNSLADTVVHVEEFVAVVKQALKLGINSRLVQLQGPPES